MPVPVSARALLLLALAAVSASVEAEAQSSARARERARVERERAERERVERLRLDQERRDRDRRELQARLDRERRAREAVARQVAARQRREDWRGWDRPRISLGGGADMRQFGGNDDRYLGFAAVDFRGSSGIGVRPEVLYGRTERQLVSTQSATTSRAELLGVQVGATYAFGTRGPIRPYLLGGAGVYSVRTTFSQAVFENGRTSSRELNFGLNGGAGLEFDLGPISLFSELRYLLLDPGATSRLSGMVPITAGVRF